MANSQLIYSVKEIFTDYLSGEYKYYNIPEYQRGYKWTIQQIKQLLDDIDRFQQHGNDDRFYCVQNITLVEKKTENNNLSYYNVVDGQQRLTTLIVLLSYLGETKMIEGKLNYSVRPDTDYFIRNFIIKPNITKDNWTGFLETNTDQDYDHQDIYYLFSAYKCISHWMQDRNIDKENFKGKLLNNVKLIINKPYTDNEQELFMNLNTGRVSLDGADLVRALLITNVAKEELENTTLEDTKSIVKINERRVRIGLELDEISAWWNQPNVSKYFDFLDKISAPGSETIEFDSEKHPIDLLYKLYVVTEGKKDIRLQYFENQKYIELYKRLITLHRTIKDWYQDCEIYHYVKYILTQSTKNTFTTIWSDWTRTKSRQCFVDELKDKSREIIETFIDEIDKLNADWYANEDERLYKILIMSDIVQIIKSHKYEDRMSFLPADYFKPRVEDIEHIFPQTPIGAKNNKVQSDFKAYIEVLNNLSDKYNETADEANKIAAIVAPANWADAASVEFCQNKINSNANKLIHRNSIGNLVLLNEKINRGYGNDFYTRKRIEIVKNPRRKFIRPHTLRPFIKGYLQEPDALEVWTDGDIRANAEYLKQQIKDFFNLKEAQNEQA